MSEPRPDPAIRRLLAQIADTEWQLVEVRFQNAVMRGAAEIPAVFGQPAPAAKGAPRRIQLERRFDIVYWTMTLRVTESALRDAVAAVGSNADAVRRYLSA